MVWTGESLYSLKNQFDSILITSIRLSSKFSICSLFVFSTAFCFFVEITSNVFYGENLCT